MRIIRESFKGIKIIIILSFMINQLNAQVVNDTSFLLSFNPENIQVKNQKVSTASRFTEDIFDAPSIISVLTEEQIKKYRANSLFELLDRIAGIYTLGTVFLPNNMISIRGDNTVHFNTRVLILLNGRPLQENLQGGSYMAIHNMFPVSRIAKLEIIRGPGSVLYGTGAYTGVINIISKTVEKTSLSASILGGSFGRLQSDISLGINLGNGWQLNGGINLVRDNGWQFTATDETVTFSDSSSIQRDANNTQSIKMNQSGFGAELLLSNKRFKINSYYGSSKQSSMYFTQWLPINLIEGTDTTQTFIDFHSNHQWLFTDILYDQPINNFWKVTINYTLNSSVLEEANIIANDNIAIGKSTSNIFEVINYFEFNKDKGNLLVGGNIKFINGYQKLPEREPIQESPGFIPYNIYNLNLESNPNPLYIIPNFFARRYVVYSQFKYNILQNLNLIAGFQGNKIAQDEWSFVPRVSLLYRHGPLLGFKLLYGQAYREPSFNEWLIQFPPIIEGNSQLSPELIQTFELQANFRSLNNKFQGSFSYFKSIQKDLIFRFSQPLSVDTYVNGGERDSEGIEFESRFTFSTSLEATLSASWQTSYNLVPTSINLDKNPVTFKEAVGFNGAPEFMFKGGLSYQSQSGFDISVFNIFYDEANLPQQSLANGMLTPQKVNPEAGAVLLTNIQLTLYPYKILKNNGNKHLSLQLYVSNLWNSEVMMPEYTRRVINTLPARAGRGLYGILSYSF